MSATTSLSEASAPFFVGVDVGGTNIKIGVVDDQGRSLTKTSLPTESQRGVPDAIARIVATMDRIREELGLARTDVAAVGLATPGTMDLRKGMILEPPNLPGWRHFPIRDSLRDACGYPVSYANDATAAGFGEFWVGSGREARSMVLLTLGTGVGGGIILDGKTLDGEHDHGSEVGHVPIETGSHGRLCGCGQRGHLEAYCSATAVAKRARELLHDQNSESSLRSRIATGDLLTTRMLFEEAERSDSLALEVIRETADYLAVGLVTVAHLLDPAMLVLGGAMDFGGIASPVGRGFLERVRSEFRRQCFPVVAQATTIDFALLGGDAGYIGAAGLAREVHTGRETRLY